MMNEHMFIVYHLKPKVFSQSIEIIVRRELTQYDLKPIKNATLFATTNQLYPVVYHSTILKLEKLC